MKKNKSLFSLFQLYLSYHLNKVLLIVLTIILSLWCIILVLNTGIPLNEASYIIEFKNYHFSYLEQSIFFLQLINGVIVSLLVGEEINSLSLFDPMLVPNTSRIRLILAKILSNLFILLIILVFQILCLELVGVIIFPKFVVTLNSFKIILYMLFPLAELLLLGELISLLLNSYFIPILIFIFHIIGNILLKTEHFSEVLCLFIPKIIIKIKDITLSGNIPIYLGICFLLVVTSILVFQKKDISY